MVLIITVLIGISSVSATNNNQTITQDNDSHMSSDTMDLSKNISKNLDNMNRSSQLNSTVKKEISLNTTQTTKTLKQETGNTVTKSTSKMSVSNKTVIYNSNVQLVATVVNKATGKYATIGKVAFKINDKTVGYGTVSNGKAYYLYDSSKLTVQNYKITAEYEGSSILTSASATGILKVIKRNTMMTVSNKTIYAGNSVQLVATVVDKITGKYISGGKVVFKVDGKTVGYGTVSNGKAYYKYNTIRNAGTYTLSACYEGNSIYNSITSKSSKLSVLKNIFTYSQIKTAAVYLRNQFESDHIISQITVGSTKMELQDFLPLMIHMVKLLNNGKTSDVVYQHYDGITSQTDTLTSGIFTKSQMMNIANTVLNNYQNNNKPPAYVSTHLGKLGYYNIIYLFSKMMDVSTSTCISETWRAYNWNTIHPTNIYSRPIYISCDNVYSKQKDKAFVNKLKSILEQKGFEVYILGIGPNTHGSSIWAGSLPSNAVQLSLFGGADAGVIYDVCTRSFMRTKANRLVFFAYDSDTSLDITGLSWLTRAHDDNYSPSSFKGLSNPDDYLKNHGYDYVFTNNANTIVNALINYIKS